jgi:uroporphyrinogen decarboxylase
MNPYEIKKKYGKSLSFWGTVDVQHVMPFGTTPEVIGEVRERLKTVGPGGGFILCSAHCIQPSARAVDNIFAYYWAANKFGNYPLEK